MRANWSDPDLWLKVSNCVYFIATGCIMLFGNASSKAARDRLTAYQKDAANKTATAQATGLFAQVTGDTALATADSATFRILALEARNLDLQRQLAEEQKGTAQAQLLLLELSARTAGREVTKEQADAFRDGLARDGRLKRLAASPEGLPWVTIVFQNGNPEAYAYALQISSLVNSVGVHADVVPEDLPPALSFGVNIRLDDYSGVPGFRQRSVQNSDYVFGHLRSAMGWNLKHIPAHSKPTQEKVELVVGAKPTALPESR